MAGFSINTITVDGVALIARAAATSQLIYTRVLSATAAMTEQAAGTAQVGDFDGAEGSILSASASDDRAIIRGVIYNQPSEITLKTFAICAKIDGDASDVVLAVQSDPDAEVIVPADTTPTVGVEVDFLITIADAENVTVESIGPGTVSFGDLDRFVSMYKAGDPTSGEAQTIYGMKTFSDSAHFASGLTASGGLFPDAANNTYQIGDGNTQWYGASFSGTVTSKFFYGQYFYPSDDEHSFVGRPSDPFRDGYFAYLTVETFTAIDIYAYSGQTCVIGTESSPFDEAYISTVHADSLDGLIPYPTLSDDTVGATVTVPVGGIVGVFLEAGTSHGFQDVTGVTRTISANQVHTCIFNDSSSLPRAGFYYIPAGTYVGLGGGSTVTGGNGFAILMRIA